VTSDNVVTTRLIGCNAGKRRSASPQVRAVLVGAPVQSRLMLDVFMSVDP
jgi:hypothetical protein